VWKRRAAVKKRLHAYSEFTRMSWRLCDTVEKLGVMKPLLSWSYGGPVDN
jgi:hypothetical protein